MGPQSSATTVAEHTGRPGQPVHRDEGNVGRARDRHPGRIVGRVNLESGLDPGGERLKRRMGEACDLRDPEPRGAVPTAFARSLFGPRVPRMHGALSGVRSARRRSIRNRAFALLPLRGSRIGPLDAADTAPQGETHLRRAHFPACRGHRAELLPHLGRGAKHRAAAAHHGAARERAGAVGGHRGVAEHRPAPTPPAPRATARRAAGRTRGDLAPGRVCSRTPPPHPPDRSGARRSRRRGRGPSPACGTRPGSCRSIRRRTRPRSRAGGGRRRFPRQRPPPAPDSASASASRCSARPTLVGRALEGSLKKRGIVRRCRIPPHRGSRTAAPPDKGGCGGGPSTGSTPAARAIRLTRVSVTSGPRGNPTPRYAPVGNRLVAIAKPV